MSFGGPAVVSIAAATDVALNSPATGNFLGYDTPTAKWQNLGLTGRAALANKDNEEAVNFMDS